MCGQRHAPAALPPRKTRYPLYGRLGGPQSQSGQVRKISPPTGIRSPDRSARSESLYRLSYSGPLVSYRIVAYRLDNPVREAHLFASAFLGRKCLSMFNAVWQFKIVATRGLRPLSDVYLHSESSPPAGAMAWHVSSTWHSLTGAFCNVKCHVLRK